MSNDSHLFKPIHHDDPVFQDGEFHGREGLVRNVIGRVTRGESLNIVGGPKLGKTSILLRLAWIINASPPTLSNHDLPAVYLDVRETEDCNRLAALSERGQSILMLDNCESLLADRRCSLIDLPCIQKGPTVFAGARKWKEFIDQGGFDRNIRHIPLAVFLEKEAQPVLSLSLSDDQKSWILTYGGTHPFMLKVLQAEVLSIEPSRVLDDIRMKVQETLITFFEKCAVELQRTSELNIFKYLVDIGNPVNPKKVAEYLEVKTIKPEADRLCASGLISRWIRNEEATLSAENRLFNEWFMKSSSP